MVRPTGAKKPQPPHFTRFYIPVFSRRSFAPRPSPLVIHSLPLAPHPSPPPVPEVFSHQSFALTFRRYAISIALPSASNCRGWGGGE